MSDKPHSRYWYDLVDQDIALTKPQRGETGDQAFIRRQRLVKVLRAEGYNFDAEKILTEDWQRYEHDASQGPKYIQTAEALASLKVDLSDLNQAIYCYQSVLKYDRLTKPISLRHIARDLNNLGLVYYLRSCTASDTNNRLGDQRLALSYYREGEKSFTELGLNDNLYANLINQYLLLQDSGDKSGAKIVFARITELSPAEPKSDHELRMMMLQQD
jgi:tetratricopeptide (TPR) repeat protein